MNRLLLAFAVVLLLGGCKSEEEKKADWMGFCTQGEFSPKQCEVLYSMKKASDDAEDSAAASSLASGMAMGMSAGMSSGFRR